MADIALTSHTNLMNQRAQGKKLHRRTQSSSKHDLNGFINKKNDTEEFQQDMIQNQQVLNADATQNALEADATKQTGNEIEVIVDDIEEIPTTGFVVPKASNYNPINLVFRRNPSGRIGSVGNLDPVQKLQLFEQLQDHIEKKTGLGTIHEKKNSMESMDTETLGARSPGLHSISNSQGSKNPSRAHSKHSSLDIRPGHSKTSSADFRNLNFIQPLDLKPQSQTSKAEKENIHFTKKPSNFSNQENNEVNLASFGIVPNKKLTHSRSQNPTLNNFLYKNTETHRISPKGQANPLPLTDTISPKGTNLHSAKIQVEKGTKTIKSNFKCNTYKEPSTRGAEVKFPVDITSYTTNVDPRVEDLAESMKNLANKTELMESQIRNIFSVVDTFVRDRNHLEEKVRVQDEKIRMLMGLASKYEDEINNLKNNRSQKSGSENGGRTSQKKHKDTSGPALLTTATDISSIESPGSDSSGFYTNKESRDVSKTLNFTLTPQGQRMFPSKNERTGHESSSKRAQGAKAK